MFSSGLAPVSHGDFKAGFIDTNGQIQIPLRFNRTLGFSEGLADVRVGDLWGFVDRTGTMVIEARFLNATSFVDGLALVQTGDFWSYIDARGSVILEDAFRPY
jgi:hypothetical protein